jgi:hypothetical protein
LALFGDQFVSDLFVMFAEIASPGVSHPRESEPVGAFGMIRELGSDDVEQFIGSDMAARCFGVEPGGKFGNGDRHHDSLGRPSALLVAFV